MAVNFFNDAVTGRPFVTKQDAEKKAEAVQATNNDSAYWLKMHGIRPKTVTTVEVVGDDSSGYTVRETISPKIDDMI